MQTPRFGLIQTLQIQKGFAFGPRNREEGDLYVVKKRLDEPTSSKLGLPPAYLAEVFIRQRDGSYEKTGEAKTPVALTAQGENEHFSPAKIKKREGTRIFLEA